MAKSKKLSSAQIAALQVLAAGPAGYQALANAGAFGPTISWLETHGLSTKSAEAAGRTWSITPAGTQALASGRFKTAS